MTTVESAALSFREGTSDKVYSARLERDSDGTFAVRFAYGRRGAKQMEGEKIAGVTEPEARKVFAQLQKEKRGKGYKEESIVPSEAAGAANLRRGQASLSEVAPRTQVAAAAPSLALDLTEPPAAMLAEAIKDDVREVLARLERAGTHVSEVKLDGNRLRAVFDKDGQVALYPRGSLEDASVRFPEVHAALEALNLRSTVLDGEVGYIDATGVKMDVNVLQGRARTDKMKIRMHSVRFPMTYVAFDVVVNEGRAICDLPFNERRVVLVGAVKPRELLDVVAQRLDLVAHYHEVVKAGGEGTMVKEREHRYVGTRSGSWLKAKAPNFVDSVRVVGLLAGEGSRATSFGAFVLARVDDEGDLVYWGKAGSGLSNELLAKVMDALPAHKVASSPLVGPPPKLDKEVIAWLDGRIECDVKFEQSIKLGPRFPRVVSIRVPGDP